MAHCIIQAYYYYWPNKINEVLKKKQSMFFEDYFILYCNSEDRYDCLIYMEGEERINELDKRLLTIFYFLVR